MAANSRLTIAVHILAWMALASRRGREVMTSEEIAASLATNPVIVRRSLGELRAAGLVASRRGAGAGWRLTRGPESITVLDVHDALGAEPLFALHPSAPNLECPVGHGIRPVLTEVYAAVDEAVRRELGGRTVADVLAQTLAAKETA
ncbi:Rrf2 family transcriptional regulator [Glycomyces terrestris]|uniref:Rrf2 family transcriptional regulator n=1 Tax=Glycomyces terrestris TaxID=2493553 RepID=A0A426V444_9ACTN|nr:Rrf2 family transcriptional regulator [Glycomyces terrestris]RRS01601.1 Rrf2 family transcriptional regulator [Glycomyces terrestris]